MDYASHHYQAGRIRRAERRGFKIGFLCALLLFAVCVLWIRAGGAP